MKKKYFSLCSIILIIFCWQNHVQSANGQGNPGMVSVAKLPSSSVESSQLSPANVIVNQIPVGVDSIIFGGISSNSQNTLTLNLEGTAGNPELIFEKISEFLSKLNLMPRRTITIIIVPPKRVKRDFLKFLNHIVKSIVGLFVPNAGFEIQTNALKDSNGYLTSITLSIVIGPAVTLGLGRITMLEQLPEANTLQPVSVSLTSFTGSIESIFTPILARILKQSEVLLNKNQPVGVKITVIPPLGSNAVYEQVLVKRITVLFDRMIPANIQSIIRGKFIEDPKRRLKMIELVIILQPRTNLHNLITRILNLNLASGFGTLIEKLTVLVNLLKPDITRNDIIRIITNIIPPKGTTNEYVGRIMIAIENLLRKLLPQGSGFQVKVVLRVESDGSISGITAIILIQPNSNMDNEKKEELYLDLYKPGTDFRGIINQFLTVYIRNPNIQAEMNNNPLEIILHVILPEGTNMQNVQNLQNIITSMMTKLIPGKKINVILDIPKENDGTLDIKIYIKPSNLIEQDFSIILTKRKQDLINKLLKLIPRIKKLVQDAKLQRKIITINLSITPPQGTTEAFVKFTMDEVLTTLSKYFPNNKLGVQAQANKDSNDYVTTLDLTIKIEPGPEIEIPQGINIDLRPLGSSLADDFKGVLPGIKNDVNDAQNDDKPAIIYINIKPPDGSGDSFITNAINTISNIIQRVFPNNKLEISATTTKNGQGDIIVVTIKLIIEPSTLVLPEGTIAIDLTVPGTTLTGELHLIIPGIKEKVDKNEIKNEPTTVTLYIKPMEGSKNDFVKQTMDKLLAIFSKIFPFNKISINTNSTKDSEGNILNIILKLEIQPNLQKPTTNNGLVIDLSKPTSNLERQLILIFPKLKEAVDENESENKTTILTINIIPPKNANQEFIKSIINKILTTLSYNFPNNKLTIKANSSKDKDGKVLSLILTLEIEPNNSPASLHINVIHIDLTRPGSDFDDEINRNSPQLIMIIRRKLDQDQPVSLEFSIKPPKNIKEYYVKIMIRRIRMFFLKKFPGNKIDVTSKIVRDPDENIINVIASVSIEPNNENEDIIQLDMNKPGFDLDDEIENALPTIKEEADENQKKNESTYTSIVLKPMKGSSSTYVQQLTNRIFKIFTIKFPNNKIEMQTRITKDPQGNVQSVTLNLTIEPSETPNNHLETQNNFIIDLTSPVSSLTEELTHVFPKIIREVQKNELLKDVSEFQFQVKPPRGSSDDFVKKLVMTILTTFSQKFPMNFIKISSDSNENAQGTLLSVNVNVSVEPNRGIKPENENLIQLDLSKPGTTLSQEISDVLPDIRIKNIKDERQNKPSIFNLVITPPRGVGNDFVQNTVNSLMTIMKKITPSNKITVSVKLSKDNNGNIVKMNVVITVEPPAPEDNQKPDTFDIDLTKPGQYLDTFLDSIAPNLIRLVENSEDRNKPLNFTIKIKPPQYSYDNFISKTKILIVDFLKRILPKNEIHIQLIPTENSQKQVVALTMIVTVIPVLSQTTTPSVPALDIDLNRPGLNLVKDLMRIVPGFIKNLFNKQPSENPVTFNLNLKPPSGITNNYIEVTLKTINNVLSKLLPDKQLEIQTKLIKNAQGQIVDVKVIITVQPADVHIQTIILNLDAPGTNIVDEISRLVPSLDYAVEKANAQKKPLDFHIQMIPPKKVTNQFITEAKNKLLVDLKERFPYDDISIKPQIKKDELGNIINVDFDVNVLPPENDQLSENLNPLTTNNNASTQKDMDGLDDFPVSSETKRPEFTPSIIEDTDVSSTLRKNPETERLIMTTPPYDSNTLINKPGIVIPLLTNEQTTTSKKVLGELLIKSTPSPIQSMEELAPSVKKPNEEKIAGITPSTDKFMDELAPSEYKTEKKITPSSTGKKMIEVTTPSSIQSMEELAPSVKKPNEENITGTTPSTDEYMDKLAPSEHKTEVTTPSQEKTTPTIHEVEGFTPLVTETVKGIHPKTTSTPKTFEQEDVDQVFPKTTSSTSKTINEDEVVFDIELTTNAEKLTTEKKSKEKISSGLYPYSEKEQDEEYVESLPFSTSGDTEHLKNVSEDKKSTPSGTKEFSLPFRLNSVKKFVPIMPITNDVINELISPFRDEIEELLNKNSPYPKRKKPEMKYVSSELNFQRNYPENLRNLMKKFVKFVIRLIPRIIRNMKNKNPTTLTLNIDTVKATDMIVKKIAESSVKILQKIFPTNYIDVKIIAKRKPDGLIKNFDLKFTLEPREHPEYPIHNLDIDLIRPGTTLIEEIRKILLTIIPKVRNDLRNSIPVTLIFRIRPPKDSTSSFAKSLSECLVPIISNCFPQNTFDVNTDFTENRKGFISTATVEITITPCKLNQLNFEQQLEVVPMMPQPVFKTDPLTINYEVPIVDPGFSPIYEKMMMPQVQPQPVFPVINEEMMMPLVQPQPILSPINERMKLSVVQPLPSFRPYNGVMMVPLIQQRFPNYDLIDTQSDLNRPKSLVFDLNSPPDIFEKNAYEKMKLNYPGNHKGWFPGQKFHIDSKPEA